MLITSWTEVFDYAAFLKYTSTVTKKCKCVCLLQNMSAMTEDV